MPIDIYGRRYNLTFGKIHRISLQRGVALGVRGGAPKMAQERILIVDGDITNAVMLKARLETLGYLVDCTFTGNEALAILNSEWVDLIIMATVLRAEMSGYQLFKEIKSKKRFAGIPIIMQSKKAGMRQMFENMGVEAFFVKSYSVDALFREINKVLEEKV